MWRGWLKDEKEDRSWECGDGGTDGMTDPNGSATVCIRAVAWPSDFYTGLEDDAQWMIWERRELGVEGGGDPKMFSQLLPP